jgi:hypothetical protein
MIMMVAVHRCLLIATVVTLFLFEVAAATTILATAPAESTTAKPTSVLRSAYWDAYIKVFTPERLKRCAMKTAPPKDGSKCSVRPAGWYSCMFDEQQCNADTSALPGMGNFTGADLGLVHPKTRCDCVDGKWKCFAWTVCAVPVTKPPATETLTKAPVFDVPFPLVDPILIDAPDQIQLAPPTATVDSCPLSRESFPTDAVCSKDLRCAFGKESCCGQTYDKMVCQCSKGSTMLSCFYTDACMFPSCDTKPPVTIDIPTASVTVDSP